MKNILRLTAVLISTATLTTCSFGAVTSFQSFLSLFADGGFDSGSEANRLSESYDSAISSSISETLRTPDFRFDEKLLWAQASASVNFFQDVSTGALGPFTVSHENQAFSELGSEEDPVTIQGLNSQRLGTGAGSIVSFRFTLDSRSLIHLTGSGVIDDRHTLFLSSTTGQRIWEPGDSFIGAFIEVPAGDYEFYSGANTTAVQPGSGFTSETYSPSLELNISPVSIPEPSISLLSVCSFFALAARRTRRG